MTLGKKKMLRVKEQKRLRNDNNDNNSENFRQNRD